MPPPSAEQRREQLVALFRHLRDCHDCPLKAGRTRLVFGAGDADADLMFVGEAPGAQEDLQGLPFVGRAGRLLDQLLGEIGLERRDVFINNVLMCRPPRNRDPLPEEIAECAPFLMRRIELIRPRVVCTLGNFATKLLSGSSQGITRVHGRPLEREIAGVGLRLYPLFHPAAALRTPSVKELLRQDFARIPELLAEQAPTGSVKAAPVGDGEPGGSELTEGAAAPAPVPQLGLFG